MTRNHPDNPLLGPRDEHIIANLPLVKSIAWRYRRRAAALRISQEDVISEGTLGLIRAYDNYADPAYAFSTFATSYIHGVIRRFLSMGTDKNVRLPVHILGYAAKIKRHSLEDAPPCEIAAKLGITVKMAASALEGLRLRNESYIDAEEDPGSSVRYSSTSDFTGIHVESFLASLSPRNVRIVRLLMEGRTQAQIAEVLGVSRQLVTKSISQIRAAYTQDQAAELAA
ncbi:sigma-70 family RNA polymerase sigma factor [Paenibacillus chibensis]|uniref:sigma-70 family RNA polymerase sigma factor n=1 Tax=Paenibacillus chibensis TaxID=59846 RepID=UPI000FD86736|nr:sigma-70 family RNA polymerase sigma factor [Paenibacillus chibensis]MEC0369993.1 sigma-70 family RNA polymerase sigma factor [Paenibacillus chibensis]